MFASSSFFSCPFLRCATLSPPSTSPGRRMLFPPRCANHLQRSMRRHVIFCVWIFDTVRKGRIAIRSIRQYATPDAMFNISDLSTNKLWQIWWPLVEYAALVFLSRTLKVGMAIELFISAHWNLAGSTVFGLHQGPASRASCIN